MNIFQAISQENLEAVKEVAQAGADINAVLSTNEGMLQYVGFTPLLAAIYNDCLPIVDFLLEDCDADIHFKDFRGKTALTLAIEQKHTALVKRLIEQKTNVNEICTYHHSLYHYAIDANHGDAMRLLHEAGTQLAERETIAELMAHACRVNAYECAPVLLEMQPDLNLTAYKEAATSEDEKEKLYLSHAIFNGSVEMVAWLLEHGSNPNVYRGWRSYHRSTPLMLVINALQQDIDLSDAMQIIKLLVKHGADTSLADHDGHTVYEHITRSDYYLDKTDQKQLRSLIESAEQQRELDKIAGNDNNNDNITLI